MIFGVRLSSNSSIPRLLPNETTHQPVSIGPSSHAQSPVAQLGEQNKSSLNGADTTTDKQASVSSVLSGPPSQQQSPSAHFKEQNGNSPNGAGTLGDPFLANQTSLESNVPRMPSQIPSSAPQLEEQNRNSLNGAQTPVDPFVGNQTSQGETSENLPEITDSELPKTPGDSNSFLVLLFEKFLSASDADRKLARLVLPKLCAEVYFLFTPDGQRFPIEVQDTTGKDWKFYFRVWRNGHGRMYVLEGLRKYMALMDWKAGDKVCIKACELKGA
ncbi:B3 domain-containing transcription repressor VAL1 isoform X2 [Morus notabilis]|uniref:B3 domain-containing transcription repressor VAL1 isoform X2 n=1 Tax=Morus notabilis TaxID=981085 RepID=UPI000CED3B5D|nr:B3 domain-containing transcription repressor VAL1 isoform X2 [Morus notabilis]